MTVASGLLNVNNYFFPVVYFWGICTSLYHNEQTMWNDHETTESISPVVHMQKSDSCVKIRILLRTESISLVVHGENLRVM